MILFLVLLRHSGNMLRIEIDLNKTCFSRKKRQIRRIREF